MASQEWDMIDNEIAKFEECYCAFIDILGYKDKLSLYLDGQYNLEGRFYRALNVVYAVKELNELFADKEEMRVQFFSDSIVVYLPKKNTYNRFFNFIKFCEYLSAHLSMEDLLVRGGISLGKHKEVVDEKGVVFLASDALRKAYQLELQASNPRILIDPDIITHLENDMLTGSFYQIAKERDEYFVHFAPLLINKDGNNAEDVLKEMIDLKKEADSSQGKIQDKYRWVLDYYYWQLSNTQNVDMSLFSDFAPIDDRGFSLCFE